ncbi:uncharacterized protein SETTUDRAFT_35551 [Exserohilum turcica Et28A]|uniref:Uncharacterized protein n=1 Tax=Exserohilum turcicum (strain 28A) TaxID=671987 RepID=R0I877_EXST2|nr:uncharacterized protein SETTUDRAFT_35551 [Exserohilum turcica Et28A]EOA81730.1 hypothetical protein SETTUDRAFT_35551 [Exserohilum turcica Et28A]
MQSINDARASGIASKPVIKKVKVVNRGSEIKMMSASAEAARKSAMVARKALDSSSGLKQIPQKASEATLQHFKGAIEKQAPKKAHKASIAVNHNTASNPHSMHLDMKKPRIGQRDELDPIPKKHNLMNTKRNTLAKENEHRKALFLEKGSGHNISPRRQAALRKQPTSSQDATFQRIKDTAIKTLEQRCRLVQLALEGLMPLLKNNEAIETAVAVLEQQIDHYRVDMENLKLLGCGSQMSHAKGTYYQVLLALASWGLDVRKTSETSGPGIRTNGTDSVKARNQAREKVAHPRMKASELDAGLDDEVSFSLCARASPATDRRKPFGPSPDMVSGPVPTGLGTRLSLSPYPNSFSVPSRSSKSSILKTQRPSTTSIAHLPPPRSMSIVDTTKNNKPYTVNGFKAARTSRNAIATEKSEDTKLGFFHRKNDNVAAGGGGAKPRLHVNSHGDLKLRKRAVEIDQGKKRKREIIHESANKRVELEGRLSAPFRARRVGTMKDPMNMDTCAELSCVGLGFAN